MSHETFAIIDTGTNTFHLLIVEKTGSGNFTIIHKSHEAVKLAENGITSNIISEVPFKRGVAAFEKFKSICNENNIETIHAFGTAALRRAANSIDFRNAVKEKTGIDIKVISGIEEAHFIWNGVRHALLLGEAKSLIMDIGGGSTEFIIANESEIFWKESFEAGAALLLEKFKPGDPITHSDITTLEHFFSSEFESLISAINIFQPEVLIGSSGSFDTFADVITLKNNVHQLLLNKTTYEFEMSDYLQLHHELLISNHAARLAMPGMLAMRADMIVVASILTNFVIRTAKIKYLKLSTYALKEGVLFNLLNE